MRFPAINPYVKFNLLYAPILPKLRNFVFDERLQTNTLGLSLSFGVTTNYTYLDTYINCNS